MQDKIPKIIHQTWKTRELPEDYARYVDTVRAHHPHWEYWLWTDADNRAFIASHFSWFLPTFDGYRHHIERVDAVRYFILLHYGGLYVDMDMECLRPVDPLILSGAERELHFSLLASPTVENTIIANALMAARPGHPFFAYLTRRLPYLVERDVTFADVFDNTGPEMLTRQVKLFERVFDFKIWGLDVVCDRRLIGDPRIAEGRTIDEIRAEALLYFVHHHTNTWNVQHPPPPTPPDGYVLLLEQDIPGFDIDYVEYPPGDYSPIANATSERPEAIAFNYNGFIKAAGGRIMPCPADSEWTRAGIVPWICVKSSALEALRANS